MLGRRMLKLDMDSSYIILKFSNLVVRSFNLEILTLDAPSWAALRISHAFFASVQVLISLNIFLSTPLNIEFKALPKKV